MEKTKLGLQLPTDPRWADLAEKSLEFILTDHAYCEQKAASFCISLIQLFPEKEEVVEALAPIVSEEWGHFRLVLAEIKKRGLKLGNQRKDEYVQQVLKVIRKGDSRNHQLVERLLFGALIEARSAERFRILWKNLKDEYLSEFYYKLMVSEAGHYRMFLDLAKLYLPEDVVMKRWQEFLDAEAEIMKNLSPDGTSIH